MIEQSIGRGLRLPYGKRTGIIPIDRLNIIAHDRFQEIIEEANRPDSAIRLQQVILDPAQLQEKTVTVVSLPVLDIKLGLQAGADACGYTKLQEEMDRRSSSHRRNRRLFKLPARRSGNWKTSRRKCPVPFTCNNRPY